MKKILLALFTLLCIGLAHAQVKIGDNPTTINSSSILELESTTKTFIPPRMSTVQRDAISSPEIGSLIFNTSLNCLEQFLGLGATGTSSTGWKNLCKANINASFTASTLNCTGTLSGDYVATVPMIEATGTNPNSKIVTVTVATPGDYTITTNEVNGVIFSGEGTISSAGTGTQIKLYASGTPTNAGTFTYTVTLNGQTCTFTVIYSNPPAVLLNGSVDCSGGTLNGLYVRGVAMVNPVNYYTVTTTPTSIGFCNLTSNTVNGITFSGSSTFVTGDLNNIKTITLIASGTPTNAGTFTYTVTGTNVLTPCSFTVTFSSAKQYMIAKATASTITTNSLISWSSLANFGVTVSGSNITLKAGKTYELTANLLITGGNYLEYAFVNQSGTQLPNSIMARYGSNTQNYTNGSYAVAKTIYTVGSSDEVINVKVLTASASASLQNSSTLKIVEINPTKQDYLFAYKTSTQTVANNTNITFVQAKQNGGISISGASITLKANKTYYIESALNQYSTGSGYLQYQLVNASNGVIPSYIGQGDYVTVNSTSYSGGTVPIKGIYKVGSSDEIVKIRTSTTDITGGNFQANDCYFYAVEIPSTAYYATATNGSNQTGVVANTDYNWSSTNLNGVTYASNVFTLPSGRRYLIEGLNQLYGRAWENNRIVGSTNNSLANSIDGTSVAANNSNTGNTLFSTVLLPVSSSTTAVKNRQIDLSTSSTRQGSFNNFTIIDITEF
jgi:hypothetical protein